MLVEYKQHFHTPLLFHMYAYYAREALMVRSFYDLSGFQRWLTESQNAPGTVRSYTTAAEDLLVAYGHPPGAVDPGFVHDGGLRLREHLAGLSPSLQQRGRSAWRAWRAWCATLGVSTPPEAADEATA
ncbi:MAG: hypothetical protein Q8S13_12040, partial [Dehalococcoidia bacterium]|nr:hypothetical protein [Dehalococcoidia bacterium]